MDGVGLLERGVDVLLDASCLARLSEAELLDRLDRFEVVRRRLAAVDHLMLAEAEQRGLGCSTGAGSIPALLTGRWQVAPGQARARVRAAMELGPRVTMHGEPVEPVLPALATASRDGSVSGEQATVIRSILDRIPAETPYGTVSEVTPGCLDLLLESAVEEHPGQLERIGEALLARLDPDGTLPDDDELDARRDITVRRLATGMVEVRARLLPETGEATHVLLDALGAPAPADDGIPDTRTAGQRRHDAWHEAVRHLLTGDLPTGGGVPVTVIARIAAADLAADVSPAGPDDRFAGTLSAGAPAHGGGRWGTNDGSSAGTHRRGGGTAVLGHGGLISARRLLAMICHGCQAEIHTVRIGDQGQPLSMGRRTRLATRIQRLALVARDGGCAFPGCDAPAAWCEAHHVDPWAVGGPTDIDNLCLLCPRHHRLFEKAGWVLAIVDGVPSWTPPVWLDPHRRPRRNHAHHPPDIAAWLAGRRTHDQRTVPAGADPPIRT